MTGPSRHGVLTPHALRGKLASNKLYLPSERPSTGAHQPLNELSRHLCGCFDCQFHVAVNGFQTVWLYTRKDPVVPQERRRVNSGSKPVTLRLERGTIVGIQTLVLLWLHFIFIRFDLEETWHECWARSCWISRYKWTRIVIWPVWCAFRWICDTKH